MLICWFVEDYLKVNYFIQQVVLPNSGGPNVSKIRSLLFSNPRLFMISLVSFCLALSVGFVIPLFPLYLKSLGASLALIGLVTTLRGITGVFLRAPTGALSDKLGRKPFIITGAVIYTVIPLIYAQIENPIHMIPIMVIHAIGIGSLLPPMFAYVADITDPKNRGKAMGGFSTIFGWAYTIGMATSGFFIERFSHHFTFQMASVIALIGLLIAIFGIKEVRKSETEEIYENSNEDQPSFMANLKILLRNPSLMLASIALLASSVINTTLSNFLQLYADENGIRESTISSLMGVNSGVSTTMQLPGGFLADKLNKKLALSIGILVCVLPVTFIPMTTVIVVLLILLVISGAGEGFVQAISLVLITSEQDLPKGFSVGLSQVFSRFGKSIVPVLSGVISEKSGVNWAFWTGVLFAGPIFLVALLTSRRMEKRTQKPQAT